MGTGADAIGRNDVLDALHDAIAVIDSAHTVQFANAAYIALFGGSAADIVGRPLFDGHGELSGDAALASLLRAVSNHNASVDAYDVNVGFTGYGRRRLRISALCIRQRGAPSGLSLVSLSDRSADDAEAAETAARLAQTEARVVDVHHRARNNLASILSMLRLEHRALGDRAIRRVLERISLRIEAVSWGYEMMRTGEADTGVELLGYLRQLGRTVDQQTSATRRGWHMDVSGDAFPVTLDNAVSIGMLVGELLTDAAGIDFGDAEAPGIVALGCRRDGAELRLTIDDTRRGAVVTAADDAAAALSRKLVDVYLAALGGQITRTGSPGEGMHTTLRLPYNGLDCAADGAGPPA